MTFDCLLPLILAADGSYPFLRGRARINLPLLFIDNLYIMKKTKSFTKNKILRTRVEV